MIDQVMNAINNHFIKTVETSINPITTTGIEGSFSNPYFTNQYIWVTDTTLNDGVYKLTGATTSKLTAVMSAEVPNVSYVIYGCAPPKEFITLVANIESWVASVGIKNGINSESIDDYSVSFDASKGSPGDWKTAFASQLNAYRKVYDSVPIDYNLKTKGWF